MSIKIEKNPSKEKLSQLNVAIWPVWEMGPSDFPWFYDSEEQSYFVAGDVIVKTDDGEFHIEAGDLVTFPAGLSCEWVIRSAVKKHYCFR